MQRSLLIDLDGTLVDSLPDLQASCNRFMAKLGLTPFGAEDVRAMIGDGAAALLRKAMAARGRTPTDPEIAAFVADYSEHAAEATVAYPGVPETLDRLRTEGWRLAVCTNKPAIPTRTILRKLRLIDYFAAIGAGDSYPVRKPDPGHLLATLADADGNPQAAVSIGDHHNDLAAAGAAGIPAIFAAWGYGPATLSAAAAATAQTFPDLPALADALRPRST